MRPPASDMYDLSCLDNHDVTSGLSLAAVSDWRNLTTDTSIQIAYLDDLTMSETSFYQSHTSCLKHVQTIDSPPREGAGEQVKDAYVTKTLVTLNSLATTSGHLLDSRLIFSPTCDKLNTTGTRRRKGRETGSSRYATIPGASGSGRQLWHSDSELFLPQGESVQLESKSVDNIVDMTTEDVSLVKPLAALTHRSKISEIRPVRKLGICQERKNAVAEDCAWAKVDVSCKDTTDIKMNGAVSKVYNKLSRSLKKKRRTIANVGNLTDLLEKVKMSMTSETRDKDTSEKTGFPNQSNVSSTRQALNFGNASMINPKSENTVVSSDAQSQNQRFIAPATESDKVPMSTYQTAGIAKRRPVLGVRRKELPVTCTIDNLDMDVVCDLKKRLSSNSSSNASRIKIKTNGSLKNKPLPVSAVGDRSKLKSPRRSVSLRCGTAGVRPTRRCIVSTV